MRVLHIVQRYWPFIGGSEKYFQEFSERLAADGHAVTILTTNAWDLEYFWDTSKRHFDPGEETHNGVRVHRVPVRHLPLSAIAYPGTRLVVTWLSRLPGGGAPLTTSLSWTTPLVPGLHGYLRSTRDQYDLVHVANVLFDGMLHSAQAFARRRRIPLVVTPFTHIGESDDDPVGRHYTMPNQIRMLREAAATLVMTSIERGYLARRGVPESKVFTIGAGVTPEEMAGGDGARFRANHNITGPIVFYIGPMARDKGVYHLVEALRRLWAQGSEATLVLAGPPMAHLADYLAGALREEPHRLRVLGFISDGEKRDLLAAGDLFAMPSRTDSFGIVYLEAWLYGLPVIGAEAGGVPGVITDGEDGYLVRYGDVDALVERIGRLLADRTLARTLGEAGRRKTLAQHTWARKYAQLRDLYASLVG